MCADISAAHATLLKQCHDFMVPHGYKSNQSARSISSLNCASSRHHTATGIANDNHAPVEPASGARLGRLRVPGQCIFIDVFPAKNLPVLQSGRQQSSNRPQAVIYIGRIKSIVIGNRTQHLADNILWVKCDSAPLPCLRSPRGVRIVSIVQTSFMRSLLCLSWILSRGIVSAAGFASSHPCRLAHTVPIIGRRNRPQHAGQDF
jgi:hypothetical protein